MWGGVVGGEDKGRGRVCVCVWVCGGGGRVRVHRAYFVRSCCLRLSASSLLKPPVHSRVVVPSCSSSSVVRTEESESSGLSLAEHAQQVQCVTKYVTGRSFYCTEDLQDLVPVPT